MHVVCHLILHGRGTLLSQLGWYCTYVTLICCNVSTNGIHACLVLNGDDATKVTGSALQCQMLWLYRHVIIVAEVCVTHCMVCVAIQACYYSWRGLCHSLYGLCGYTGMLL